MRLRAAFPRTVLCAALGLVLAAGAQAADRSFEVDFSGSFGLSGRWYPETGAYPGQGPHGSGFVVEPTLFVEDSDGRSLTLTPFLRYDSVDERRTHVDLREAYLLLFGQFGDGEWELRLGMDRVFWGVAESNHLVDIVNQADTVEHPNEKSRLGQPMVHLTLTGHLGTAELFLLPFHRQRTYPGRRGRWGPPLEIDPDEVEYESSAGQHHVDLAARYSHSFGPLDLGLSAFHGTTREPILRLASFRPIPIPGGPPIWVPHTLGAYYPQISQVGLDAQLTVESWLFKLEAIHRAGLPNALDVKDDFAGAVLGAEYTFHSVFESAADLNLLGEWSYDGRRLKATRLFQNDVFLAARLTLNDMQGTEVTAALLYDLDYVTRTVTIGWARRLSDQWSLRLEAALTFASDDADFIYLVRRDSFIGLDLVYNL